VKSPDAVMSTVNVFPFESVMFAPAPASSHPIRGSAGVVGVVSQNTTQRKMRSPPDAVHEKSAHDNVVTLPVALYETVFVPSV